MDKQLTYKCPNCGGAIAFDPGAQKMKCPYCDTTFDLETLKKAQQEPEKYMSLRVRLGGLTVYFVQLAKEQQDEYMRRTEHNI